MKLKITDQERMFFCDSPLARVSEIIPVYSISNVFRIKAYYNELFNFHDTCPHHSASRQKISDEIKRVKSWLEINK